MSSSPVQFTNSQVFHLRLQKTSILRFSTKLSTTVYIQQTLTMFKEKHIIFFFFFYFTTFNFDFELIKLDSICLTVNFQMRKAEYLH